MNRININGVVIQGGRSVKILNNKVIVDGKDVTLDAKQITIEVHGDLSIFSVDHAESVSVKGRVGSVSTMSGNVTCGGVDGSVSTMSGDVRCEGKISGAVSTLSGDVRGVI